MEKYNRVHQLNVNATDTVTDDLPPTSTQSFMRHNRTYPAVVLHTSPTSPNINRYYHSIFDDVENIRFVYQNTSADFRQLANIGDWNPKFPINSVQMAVRNVSTLLAFALYELVTEKAYSGTVGGNAVLVSCYCIIRMSVSVSCVPVYEWWLFKT